MAGATRSSRQGWTAAVQIEPRQKLPNGVKDLSRCYSAKYVSSSLPREFGLERQEQEKYSRSQSSRFGATGWNVLSDPEIQRKKRVASYRAYSMEGKMKESFRRSFRWVKDRYRQVVRGGGGGY